METQTAELDINFYDIIFKTIYLFLETNDFQESAATFLSEIRQRYHKDVDLQLIHAKTLVLRPLFNTSLKSTSNSDPSSIQLIVNIPGDPAYPAASLTDNEHSVTQNEHTSLKCRTIICRKSSDANGQKSGSQAFCPDCQLLTKSQDELERICQLAVSLVDDDERCNWNQICSLSDSIRALREEHHKMIALISDLKTEIASLNPVSRSILLSRCHAQLNELVSYPGNHSVAEDISNLLQEPDESTENQVESSVINSTPRLSIITDFVIPLEGKSNVGNIPQLIGSRRNHRVASPLPNTDVQRTTSRSPPRKGALRLASRNKSRSATNLKTYDAKFPSVNIVNKELTTVMFTFDDSAGEVLLDATEGHSGDQGHEPGTPNGSKSVQKQCQETQPGTLDINWVELKKAMYEGDTAVRLKVLQALRWRLTQTEPSTRDRHLLDYVKQDILSVNSVQPYGQLFLESFFCPKKVQTPSVSQEEMSRFLNTLASLSMGRLYLEHDENILSVMILPLLMDKLPGVQISTRTRAFTMAIVQKLSLGNKMREVIISCGTVEWLVQYINMHHVTQNTYEAEYSVALLTNLCINKEARKRCERIADHVVPLLQNLIDTPHRCCINYINPLLFSLLLNSHINTKAVAQGIGMKLKRLYKVFKFDEELMRQFDAIMHMHHTREFSECDDCDIDELGTPNFADYIEPELNNDEESYGPPVGEDLLKTYCVPSAPESPSKRDVIKQLSSVQIVRKNYACNSHSILRLDPELTLERIANEGKAKEKNVLEEAALKQPVPTIGAAAQRMPLTKPGKMLPKKVINVPGMQNKLRVPPLKPAIGPGRIKASPKVDSRWNKDATMAQNSSKPASKQGGKQYIVNCCYKMDYAKAIVTAPGEFVPYLQTDAENCNRREHCDCLKEMQQYMDNVQRIKNYNESSSEATYSKRINGAMPEGFTEIQHAISKIHGCSGVPRKRLDNKWDRVQKLTVTDYHVLTTGTESAILGIYRGDTKDMSA